ncbi:copper-binding protein [Paracandidimonas lactea]|uniref:copper-binding protein n=1 Tax=Paracandidimonas lactea TaxID=2895524 RepID=UPI001F2E206D|nr:copper-binding protein [Paracandidimonas lactea]
MNTLTSRAIAISLALGMTSAVYATEGMKMDMDMNSANGMKMDMGASADPTKSTKSMNNALDDGVVKKVDRQTGMVSIEHGELKTVGMPAMTMAYKAKDEAMVKRAKEGEKVKFRLENLNGTYTITALEKR